MVKLKLKIPHCFTFEKNILRALASWCMINFIMTITSDLKFTKLAYMQDFNLKIYALLIFSVFVVLSVTDFFFPFIRVDDYAFLVSLFAYCFMLIKPVYSVANKNSELFFGMGLFFIFAIVLYYYTQKKLTHFDKVKINKYISIGFVALFGLIFTFIVGSITVYRYLTYGAPNFDFGLFVNMFHNMKERFVPYVTSERNQLLSHFAVHISPIYYLLLPFYMIFPSPITLQVGQAVVLASGLIPLYLLARNKGLSNKAVIFFSAAYAFYPALSSGCFYDLHENCFLTPLLLWTFYFFEKKKYIPMYIFAILVFLVKEDAPVYIAFFALYIIFSRKKFKHGTALLGLSIAYFLFCTYMLKKYGMGVMSNRYNNYIYEGGSLFKMVKTVIINPGYVFTQTLNVDKLVYLIKIMLPLGFLPFLSKKISRFILLLPLVLLALMTNYGYQYDIGFQYQFGIIAFLFYISLLNLSEMEFSRRFYLSFIAVATSFLFLLTIFPRYITYRERYKDNKATYLQLNEILDDIPEDASVKCTTWFVARLADRDEIYEIHYDPKNLHRTDYIIIDLRGDNTKALQSVESFKKDGYKEQLVVENLICVLVLPEYEEAQIKP